MRDPIQAPHVASYLVDVASEFSPARFRAYIADVKLLLPPDEYRRLRRAYRHLTRMRLAVRRVARRLAEPQPHQT